jgi:hypothetical protein
VESGSSAGLSPPGLAPPPRELFGELGTTQLAYEGRHHAPATAIKESEAGQGLDWLVAFAGVHTRPPAG